MPLPAAAPPSILSRFRDVSAAVIRIPEGDDPAADDGSALTWLEGTALVAVSLFVLGYHYPSVNQVVEAPPLLALTGQAAYPGDFFVQEMLRFTPRFYFYRGMAAVAGALGSLPLAYFITYLVAFTAFVLGVFATARDLTRSKATGAVAAFLAVAASSGTIGGAHLFENNPAPYVYAMALVVWAIHFCLQRRLILAYTLLGLASLAQFLVGILPALLLFPLMVEACRRGEVERSRVLAAYGVLGVIASLVYLPLILSGSTSSDLLSSASFVFTYAEVRHPHHLVPTSWSALHWANFLAFVAGAWMALHSCRDTSKAVRRGFTLLAITVAAALIADYVFVELMPVAWVAKLQLARTTPFLQLAALIVIAALVTQMRRDGRYVVSPLLAAAPLLPYGGVVLLVLAAANWTRRPLWPKAEKKQITVVAVAALLAVLLVIVQWPAPLALLTRLPNSVIAGELVLLLIIMTVFLLARTAHRQWSLAGLMLAFAALLAVAAWKGRPPEARASVADRFRLDAPPITEAGRVALLCREVCPDGALVLVPPSAWEFRLYSRRPVVVDFKGFPFTDAGIITWGNRMQTVLGERLGPQTSWRGDMDGLYAAQTPAELRQIATGFGANFVLSKAAWHGDLAPVAARHADWVLYEVGEGSR